MTRPASLGHAVHQHYASKTGDGRTRNNQRYDHVTGLDQLRELAAQAEADPLIAAGLSPHQKHQIAQLRLTDAHRARQHAGDDAEA